MISSIDELSRSWFAADDACVRTLSPLLIKAVRAEKAIAIEDELADIFEAVLAFVPMLCLLIHL